MLRTELAFFNVPNAFLHKPIAKAIISFWVSNDGVLNVLFGAISF